jgi:hypothetical protein
MLEIIALHGVRLAEPESRIVEERRFPTDCWTNIMPGTVRPKKGS